MSPPSPLWEDVSAFQISGAVAPLLIGVCGGGGGASGVTRGLELGGGGVRWDGRGFPPSRISPFEFPKSGQTLTETPTKEKGRAAGTPAL